MRIASLIATQQRKGFVAFGILAALVGNTALGCAMPEGNKVVAPGKHAPVRTGKSAIARMKVAARPRPNAEATAGYRWSNARIVGGGFVTGIIMHPTEKNLMYARTDVGGAYRWDAGAQIWVPLTDWVSAKDWTLTGIESLAVDPSDPNRVYIAAGTYTNDWSGPGAILISADRGENWERVNLPFKNGGNEDGRSAGERLSVDPNDGRILFFGTRTNGLLRSADRGKTWQPVDTFPAVATSPTTRGGREHKGNPMGIVLTQFLPTSGKRGVPTPTVFAAVSTRDEAGIFRSTDGGKTWAAVPGQPVGLRVNHAALSADGAFLYFSFADEPGPNGMSDGAIRKLDVKSGAWTDVTPIKPSPGDGFGYGGVTTDAKNPGTLMVSTMDRWTKKDELFRSIDGGKTWKPISPTAAHDHSVAPWLTFGGTGPGIGHWIGDIEIDPHSPGHVLYVTGWGIRGARDVTEVDAGRPTHWTVAAALGIEECVTDEVISPPTGAPVLSALWDIDGFRHERLDESPRDGFYKPSRGHNTGIDFAERAPDVVARVFGGGVGATGGAVSTDNGRHWSPFPSAPTGTKGQGKVAVSADGATIVLCAGGVSAHWSRDRGTTWTPCKGLPEGWIRVVSDRADPARFYAFDGKTGTLYVSEDSGTTFAAACTALPPASGYLRSVPGRVGHVWLAAGNGVFCSTDAGKTFAQLADWTGSLCVGFGKAAAGRENPAAFVVGTYRGTYGFYRSDDDGASWVRINDDRHQFGTITSITGDPRIWGRVYVGSGNRGVIVGEIGGGVR